MAPKVRWARKSTEGAVCGEGGGKKRLSTRAHGSARTPTTAKLPTPTDIVILGHPCRSQYRRPAVVTVWDPARRLREADAMANSDPQQACVEVPALEGPHLLSAALWVLAPHFGHPLRNYLSGQGCRWTQRIAKEDLMH